MTNINRELKKWIGFWEISADPNSELLEGNSGAFVHIVGSAPSEEDFIGHAQACLERDGFTIISRENTSSVEYMSEESFVGDELIALVDSIKDNDVILYDEFQAYP